MIDLLTAWALAMCLFLGGCDGDGQVPGGPVETAPAVQKVAPVSSRLVAPVDIRSDESLYWEPPAPADGIVQFEVYVLVDGVTSRLGVVGAATNSFALTGVRPGPIALSVVSVAGDGERSLPAPWLNARVLQ